MVQLPDGYRMVRTLGGDAWGSSHLAQDVRAGCPVVVETLAPAADPRRRERFLSEVGQIASLGHPHVLRVHTAGERDGTAYAITDHLDVPDLATHLATVGPLAPATALQILGPVADALDAAHGIGLVHRGLGARSVLLGPVPVLRGFGVTPDGGVAGGELDGLAPEQVTGGPVDARTDVYALGALLLRCLTGVRPYPRPVGSVSDGPPRLGDLRPDLPPGLGDVVARSMARDPGRRFATCREVIDAAAAAVGSSGAGRGAGGPGGPPPAPTVVSHPRPRRRRRTLVVLAAVVAVLALLAGAGIVFGPRVLAALYPTSDELARVPAALRGACEVSHAEGGPPGAPRLLSCRDGAGQEALVGLYDTPDAAGVAYRTQFTLAQPGVGGTIGDCADGPGFEHRYPPTGTVTGRVFCAAGATARTVWLDLPARSVSVASRSDGDTLALYRAWAGWVAIPAYPTPDERRLTGDLFETGCRRAPAASLDKLDGLVAAVTCTPGATGADSLTYYLFGDAEALRRAFQADVTAAGTPSDTYCGDPSKGAAAGQGTFDRGPVTVGRVVCATTNGVPQVSWTTDAVLVMGRVTGHDLGALKSYWQQNAGPRLDAVLRPINAQLAPSFPSAAESTLLDQVPPSAKPYCTRAGKAATANLGGGRATAVIGCSATDGATVVVYAGFPDPAGPAAMLPRVAAPGPDCQTGPAGFRGSSRYGRPGSTGALYCGTESDGTPYIVWTKDGTNVLAYAYGPTADGLIRWWQSGVAGPN